MKKVIQNSVFSLVVLTTINIAHAQAELSMDDFTGIWSGSVTTPTDEFWNVEDFQCFAGCSLVGYQFYTSLLDDPANDERSIDELGGQVVGFMRQHLAEISTEEGLKLQQANNLENDSNFLCEPYGYVKEALNPLPFEIRQEGQTLIIDYEEWNLSRTVYLDGRDFPTNLIDSSLGYSLGHIEGQALVIETRGIEANTYIPFTTGGAHSNQLYGVERFTLSENDRVLTSILTLEDPVTLSEPLVLTKHWISTPDLVILEDSCTDFPGQL
jgi:hypothetical protein